MIHILWLTKIFVEDPNFCHTGCLANCYTQVYTHVQDRCLALLLTLSKESTMIKNKTFKNSPLYCVLTAIQNNIGTFAAQKLDGFLLFRPYGAAKYLFYLNSFLDSSLKVGFQTRYQLLKRNILYSRKQKHVLLIQAWLLFRKSEIVPFKVSIKD